MSLVVPDSILQAAQVTDDELRLEIAVMLYAQDKLTLGQASEFCRMPQFKFQRILGARHIPSHYDVEEFELDMKNLESFHPS